VIRDFAPQDADAVGSLTLAAYDGYGSITGPYREQLAAPRRRAAGSTALLVAEVAGRIVGTVTFVLPEDPEWEGPDPPHADAGFRVLAVAPDTEGRGVGRALVTHCVDLALHHERRRLMLTSMAWMTRAHRLYDTLGFTRRPDLDVRFPGGIGVVYQRDLVPDAAAHFPPPGPVPSTPPWFEDVWSR